ncbi:MAG TPA: hypothetical protein VMR98_05435 [Candidatus Polarisedimenticolaceae bacterium]|nr:hypothetical protein [Candidatus Polarisedimenticolaceae bacterium]
MGKGSKTNQKDVAKQIVRKDTGTGGGPGDESVDLRICLFKITGVAKITDAVNATVDTTTPVAVAPDHNGNLHVYAGSKDLGPYTGDGYDLVQSCIMDGYIYTGKVTTTEIAGSNMLTVTYEVAGRTAS